jgi:N-acetyl-anhydromuramyl-L-alanine amidase AmpD
MVTVEYINTASISRREAGDIHSIIIHHSATASGNVEVFRKYHLKQGFADVGYHYVICNGHGGPDGEVQEGRPELMTGAHAPARNADSIGVCLVGDFTQGKPTTAQMLALYALLKDLMRRYHISPKDVLAHKEVSQTDCPGSLDVAAIRARMMKPPPKDWEGHLHEAAIKEAMALGLMVGNPDGSFNPDKPCTRAELAAVAVRTYNSAAQAAIKEIIQRLSKEDKENAG